MLEDCIKLNLNNSLVTTATDFTTTKYLSVRPSV